MVEPLSQDGRSLTSSQASGVSILEGSKAALGTEFIQFSKAVDFFRTVFQKKTFWVSLSKSCIKILFLLSKTIIHMVAGHKLCLINGVVKICRQHPTFLKSGMLRTAADAFLAQGAGVWPPTCRMFSPCMKIMQLYSVMPKNQSNAVVQILKCWQSSSYCITWSSAMEKYIKLIQTAQRVLSLYVLLRLYEATILVLLFVYLFYGTLQKSIRWIINSGNLGSLASLKKCKCLWASSQLNGF